MSKNKTKKTTHTRRNFKRNPPEPPNPCPPSSPDPSPVPRKKCVIKKAKRRKGTTGKRSSDWRGSEETCRGKSNNQDAEGRRVMSPFFIFPTHGLNQKWKQPNQNQWTKTKLYSMEWNQILGVDHRRTRRMFSRWREKTRCGVDQKIIPSPPPSFPLSRCFHSPSWTGEYLLTSSNWTSEYIYIHIYFVLLLFPLGLSVYAVWLVSLLYIFGIMGWRIAYFHILCVSSFWIDRAGGFPSSGGLKQYCEHVASKFCFDCECWETISQNWRNTKSENFFLFRHQIAT